jgi:hypothetical protein
MIDRKKAPAGRKRRKAGRACRQAAGSHAAAAATAKQPTCRPFQSKAVAQPARSSRQRAAGADIRAACSEGGGRRRRRRRGLSELCDADGHCSVVVVLIVVSMVLIVMVRVRVRLGVGFMLDAVVVVLASGWGDRVKIVSLADFG